MKKKWLLLLLIPLFAHLYTLFFVHFKDTFHPKDFEHGFEKSYSKSTSGLDYDQLDPIFSQPFHFLGSGKQMIAFESADGNYVLKLFNPMRPLKKQWYTRWKYWKRYSSLKWISREWFQKKARLKKLFLRHNLAFERLPEETGLLFVHLNPSKRVCHYVHLTDRKGKTHILALETTPFVLQKKAVLAATYLKQLDQKGVMQAIYEMEKLFDKRLRVGITDRIQTMENNYGFVNGKPIQIDVGRIRFDPDLIDHPEEERERILSNFHAWVEGKLPKF
jgi:hypothetical protein